MKKRILRCLTSGILIVTLGGILGLMASKFVLASGHYTSERTFAVSSHGSPFDGTLRNSMRESYKDQLIYEHYSWYGNKPSVTRGIVGFRDMISEACSFTGWFVGICLGCFYLLIQVVKGIREWRNARQDIIVDRAFAYWN